MELAASILIVSRNDSRTIRQSVEAALALKAPAGGFEVLVYDDMSDRYQRTLLEGMLRDFPGDVASGRLRIILGETHRGLSAGRNFAAREARGDFLFYVDGDAMPDAEWLATTLPLFGQPDTGVVASRVVFAGRRDMINGCGGTLNRFAEGVDRYFLQPVENAPEECEDVLYAMGCGMVIRRACWEAVGGFDEAIVNYYDDAEFCLRVREKGFRVVTNPRGVVLHDTQSMTRGSYRKSVWIDYGRWLTILKHWSIADIVRAGLQQISRLWRERDLLRWMAFLQACCALLPRFPGIIRHRLASGRRQRARLAPLVHPSTEYPWPVMMHDGVFHPARRPIPARETDFEDPRAFMSVGRLKMEHDPGCAALMNHARLELGLFRESRRVSLHFDPLSCEIRVENREDGTKTVLGPGTREATIHVPGGGTRLALRFTAVGGAAADALLPAAVIVLRRVVQS